MPHFILPIHVGAAPLFPTNSLGLCSCGTRSVIHMHPPVGEGVTDGSYGYSRFSYVCRRASYGSWSRTYEGGWVFYG